MINSTRQLNILDKTVCNINVDDDINASLKVPECDKIYSYIIYNNYLNEVFLGWKIEYLVSQTPEFNTLDTNVIRSKILREITHNITSKEKYVLSYQQPEPEVMLKVYNPLINSLSTKISQHWQQISFEDAYQICAMTMIELYNKGYYVNRRLLEKSFANKIYMSLRHDRNKPNFVSIDDNCPNSNNTYADIIEDKELSNRTIDNNESEIRDIIFSELKEVIIDYIGIRQWDRLLFEYGNQCASKWSRMTMMNIKRYLESQGITKDYFMRLYK